MLQRSCRGRQNLYRSSVDQICHLSPQRHARVPSFSLSPDVPDSPTIASVEEVMEDTTVSFVCSSPYVCPYDSIALQWSGYNQEASTVSGTVQLDTSGTQSQQTLTTSFSWKDHKKKLQCELSVGSLRAAGEITVKVKRKSIFFHVLAGLNGERKRSLLPIPQRFRSCQDNPTAHPKDSGQSPAHPVTSGFPFCRVERGVSAKSPVLGCCMAMCR